MNDGKFPLIKWFISTGGKFSSLNNLYLNSLQDPTGLGYATQYHSSTSNIINSLPFPKILYLLQQYQCLWISLNKLTISSPFILLCLLLITIIPLANNLLFQLILFLLMFQLKSFIKFILFF